MRGTTYLNSDTTTTPACEGAKALWAAIDAVLEDFDGQEEFHPSIEALKAQAHQKPRWIK